MKISDVLYDEYRALVEAHEDQTQEVLRLREEVKWLRYRRAEAIGFAKSVVTVLERTS